MEYYKGTNRNRKRLVYCPDEGPTLETLDYTIRIGSTPTFLYFDLYLYSAYAAHHVCYKGRPLFRKDGRSQEHCRSMESTLGTYLIENLLQPIGSP